MERSKGEREKNNNKIREERQKEKDLPPSRPPPSNQARATSEAQCLSPNLLFTTAWHYDDASVMTGDRKMAVTCRHHRHDDSARLGGLGTRKHFFVNGTLARGVAGPYAGWVYVCVCLYECIDECQMCTNDYTKAHVFRNSILTFSPFVCLSVCVSICHYPLSPCSLPLPISLFLPPSFHTPYHFLQR